jgi:hypothetical protein
MSRRLVGQYAVETRCHEMAPGEFRSAYIVERLAGGSEKKYFVMITLLETFDSKVQATERAMARGFNHAQWLARSSHPSVKSV